MSFLSKSKLFSLVVLLALMFTHIGCVEKKAKISLRKELPPLGSGEILYWEIRESVDVIILPGKITWSGRLTNLAGPPPDEIRFLIEHRPKKGGGVLESWSLEVPVNDDGTIPRMSANFPGALLKANERLRWNFTPIGGDFPGGELNLTTNYLATP